MEEIGKVRRIERVRHEIKRREVEVAHVTHLESGFVSVTFAGEALADFVSLSFDDHVKFVFPDSSGDMVSRDYTPRHFDREARQLTIEFALHGAGQATAWARAARPGQQAVIAGPRGSMIVPPDLDWHLLTGDATALPAIRRGLEELPPSARVIALIAGEGVERTALSSRARLDVHWVNSGEALVETARSLVLPPGEGFVWGAGEASTMARLRTVVSQEKGVTKETMRISAYWKRGASNHHKNIQ